MILNKGKICQIAIACDDVDAWAERYWKVLGVGPWKIGYVRSADPFNAVKYYGEEQEEFEFKYAATWWCGIEYELCQPISMAPNVYDDWMKKHGCGVQHIKIGMPTEDLIACKNEMEAMGIKVAMAAAGCDMVYYMDTAEMFGVYFELCNCTYQGICDEIYPAGTSINWRLGDLLPFDPLEPAHMSEAMKLINTAVEERHAKFDKK